MSNTRIYDAGRAVPDTAQKKITGGAYGAAGLTDINPQWRIETLTTLFGACGDGWYFEPENIWISEGTMYAHVMLYYKLESGEWSKPVHGYGGTKLTGRDDDAVKSTITDAFGNACRYLGLGADVWLPQNGKPGKAQFDTKYSAPPPASSPAEHPEPEAQRSGASKLSGLATPFQVKTIMEKAKPDVIAAMEITYGGVGFPKLTFQRAVEAIEKLKGGK